MGKIPGFDSEVSPSFFLYTTFFLFLACCSELSDNTDWILHIYNYIIPHFYTQSSHSIYINIRLLLYSVAILP